ncbi:hypothetical protein [Ensifer soli]|uniref:hypothetical protein n=1 Tax=Ciceribacter sp. sgz301302 TaxID=3342379 RepID=UPI0035B92EF4
MPQIDSVLDYCRGLWQLILADERGFERLDMTALGVWRSFLAFLWCLPASAVGWASWRMYYLDGMPSGAVTGPLFFAKLLLIDLSVWLLPLLLTGLLSLLLDFSAAFGAIVITTNWLMVPLSYAIAVPTAVALVIPPTEPLAALLSLVVLAGSCAALFRLMRTVTGGQTLLAAAITIVFVVPPLMLVSLLRGWLGVMPG